MPWVQRDAINEHIHMACQLRCVTYHVFRKYCVRGAVLLRHCSALFMKHVLPRFCRPVTPGGASRPEATPGPPSSESLSSSGLAAELRQYRPPPANRDLPVLRGGVEYLTSVSLSSRS